MVAVLIANNNINGLTLVEMFVGFYIKNSVVESIVNGFGVVDRVGGGQSKFQYYLPFILDSHSIQE